MQQLELFSLSLEESEQLLVGLSTKEWFQLRESDKNLYEVLKPIRAKLKKREFILRRQQARQQARQD